MISLPEGFKNRMRDMLGSAYPDFENEMETGAPFSGIRINPAKPGAADGVLAETGVLERVPWCGDGYYADKSVISGKHPYHIAGLFYFQEPSAMASVEALGIQNGDRVLDLCAAPGGKATQAAAKLCGSGVLVANEVISKRAAVLSENIERMGIKNALVTNESPESLERHFPGFFDKIIVDAPCSGEGMFRRERAALTDWSIAHTVSCSQRQTKILESAAKMLRTGGYIVYSTCTFAKCENEDVIDRFLDTHRDFVIEDTGLSMLSEGLGKCRPARRIFPHIHKGEGHFLALLRKTGGTEPKESGHSIGKCGKDEIDSYRCFESENLNIHIDGDFELFGERLYLRPPYIGSMDRLRILRCGLFLGMCKRGRFEPSYALSHALGMDAFKRVLDFNCGDDRISAYLRGETLGCNEKGWTVVCAGGYPLGFGKCSDGILKNHFPKGLRN